MAFTKCQHCNKWHQIGVYRTQSVYEGFTVTFDMNRTDCMNISIDLTDDLTEYLGQCKIT